ncbi:hypothetical protein ACOMHN_030951 [Nucella lapillus]
MAVCFSLRPTTCALNVLRAPATSASVPLALKYHVCAMDFPGVFHRAQAVSAPRLWTAQMRCLATQKEIDESLKKYTEGKFDTIPDPGHLEHFREKSQKKEPSAEKDSMSRQGDQQVPGSTLTSGSGSYETSSPQGAQEKVHPPMGTYTLPHPIWSEEQLYDVKITHREPQGLVDKMAFRTVKLFRGGFDVFSGFIFGERNEKKWLKRIIFLETVAGVPGMVAAMMRHMMSLRRLQRDYGWIHTLLEEAENERMHLMTALQLKQPTLLFRMFVIGSQGVFVTMFSLWYIFSPRFCHRFVGYLEEEAVKTYTKCLQDIDNGPMKHWQTQTAPELAIRYWKLPEDAMMRDVVLAIRADEAHHRLVNHTLASMKTDQFNPYKPGQ